MRTDAQRKAIFAKLKERNVGGHKFLSPSSGVLQIYKKGRKTGSDLRGSRIYDVLLDGSRGSKSKAVDEFKTKGSSIRNRIASLIKKVRKLKGSTTTAELRIPTSYSKLKDTIKTKKGKNSFARLVQKSNFTRFNEGKRKPSRGFSNDLELELDNAR